MKKETIQRKYFWDIVIVIQVILYLIVTTAIFVVHKKIMALQAEIASANMPSSHDRSMNAGEQERQLQESVARDPTNTSTRERLASFYYQQGRVNKAIEEYKATLELEPDNAELHLELGILCMGNRNLKEEAAKHFHKVLEICPTHAHRKMMELWLKQLEKE